MKIAHIADAHIGIGYPGPTPYSRFEDVTRVLDWCADRMIEEKVDLCLFAGDAFKDSKVMLDRASVEIAAFAGWVSKLAEAGINVVIISGTPSHDAVAAYDLMKPMFREYRNVCIVTKPSLLNISSLCGDHRAINIACIPGLNRSNLMTNEEYRGLQPQEVHRLMTQKITDITQGLRAQIDNDWPTVLLSHMTYSEADTGFEQLLQEHEAILTAEAIGGFNLVCLGHIHRAQKTGAQNAFYAGSPERLSFNEEDETPGFWIHEIEGKGRAVESRFIETPAREYWTLNYSHDPGSGAGSLNISSLIDDSCTWDAAGVVVRVRIDATEEQAKLLDRRKIESALYEAGAFFVQEIRIEVQRTDRARDREVTESMGPVGALDKWGAQQNMDAGEIAALKAMTTDLLQEVGK